MSNLKDKQYMLVSAVGIFVCYFYFGIMQEKITRGRYGTEENEDGTVGQRFTYTLSLVAVQCMFNYLFVKGKYSKFFKIFVNNSLKKVFIKKYSKSLFGSVKA